MWLDIREGFNLNNCTERSLKNKCHQMVCMKSNNTVLSVQFQHHPEMKVTWPSDMDFPVAWQISPDHVLRDITCQNLMISAMKIIPQLCSDCISTNQFEFPWKHFFTGERMCIPGDISILKLIWQLYFSLKINKWSH